MSMNDTICKPVEPKPIYPIDYSDLSSIVNRLDTDSFYSVLEIPKCLKKIVRNDCGDSKIIDEQYIELNVKNVTIPAITIPTQKIPFQNAVRGESSKKIEEYPDITVSVKLDSNLYNYNLLFRWISMLVDEEGYPSDLSKEDYATSYTVLLLNQYEKPIGSFTYREVIPVSVGGIEFDYSTSDAIFIDFTFSYDYISFDFVGDQYN